MSTKKSNFLPILLIGGGLAGAALLFNIGNKQDKDDMSVVDGYGSVGSGDFLGSSGVSKGYDSTDLGIEDFANNRANPDAFGLPSDGANPERVIDDSGAWSFADTLSVGLAATAAAPAAYGAAKAVGSKVASKGGLKSAGAKVASSATSSGAKALATSILKKAGVVGAVATGVSALVGTASAAEGVFNEQEIYQISQNVSTDLAAKVGIGNMVTNTQLKHATGLSAGKYPVTVASKEEAAMVNKAVGLSSGDVLKVTGNKFTSYVPEKGMQVTFSNGGSLKQAVNTINAVKAKKRS